MSKQPGWIYVLETSSLPHGIYKIGHTKNWIGENINGTSRRKGVLQTALPHEIHPIALFLVSNMEDSEGFLQNMYSQNNLQYDGGGTEWFFLPQNHIDIISKYSDVLCDGEEGLNNISEHERKVKFLQKRKEESKENQQFDLLKIKLFNLNTRKHLYLKHGAAFCQGVFEDGKFIVLKGSIISDHGIDISRHTKDSKHPLKNTVQINDTWKQLKRICKVDSLGRYVLKDDLDISNGSGHNTSMWTQGLVGSSVNWVLAWKYADYSLKQLQQDKKLDFPLEGKTDKPYKWLKDW